MEFYVYILQSKTRGTYYIGFTSDVDKRLTQHNSGSTQSTKNRGPWVCVYTEKFDNKAAAWTRERQIKSYKGGVAFKKLLS